MSQPLHSDSLLKAFLSRVHRPSKGCPIWAGSFLEEMPVLHHAGRLHEAQRIALEMRVGRVPDNVAVRAICGNPKCMSAEHLYASQMVNPLALAAAAKARAMAAVEARRPKLTLLQGGLSEVRP